MPGNPIGAQLSLGASNVEWAAGPGRLTVEYLLVGARPNTIYQVGLHLFGNTPQQCPSPNLPNSRFGNFRASNGGGCILIQAFNGTDPTIAANGYSVELGAVLTDRQGTGRLTVTVKQIPAGFYNLKFHVRLAAGYHLDNNGAGGGVDNVLFQTPGCNRATQANCTYTRAFRLQERIRIP